MTIDGRAIATEILEEVRRGQHAPLTMRAITIAPTAATRSYLSAKARAAELAGITLEVVELPKESLIDEVIAAIHVPGADAVIVQLPLPNEIEDDYVLAQIPLGKDADVLSPLAREESTLLQPVAGAVKELLERAQVDPAGKACVVVGEGLLVGAPAAAWLSTVGAQVVTLNEDTFTLPESQAALRAADIIVSGAGKAHLITPDMIKEGVVLIDAGTSELPGEEDGAATGVAGDIDPACAALAQVYTPVPGGVGPIAVACLMRNAAQLQKARIAVH